VSSAIAGQGSVADAVAKGQEAAKKVGDKYK
jgi:sorbitol/mannitol transport system substrate-binding protein